MAVYVAPGRLGQVVFALTKGWLLLLPIGWIVWFERDRIQAIPTLNAAIDAIGQRFGHSPQTRTEEDSMPLASPMPVLNEVWQYLSRKWPQPRELGTGIGLGVLMFATILAVWWFPGQYWIDAAAVQARAQEVGIDRPIFLIGGALYWTVVNALLEEYVWRWFVYRQCRVLLPRVGAILLAALCFTLHHSLILIAYTNWPVTILGSTAVFLAGAIWSGCYLRYRSLWVGYISHAFADLALAIVAWIILFG